MKPASILVLAKGYLPDDGGIERYSREIAQAYSALGHSTFVLTQCSGPKGAWQDGSVRVVNVGQHGGQAGIFLRMLWQLYRLRRRMRFDIVHATTWRTAAPAFVLGLKRQIVITVHGREVLIVPRLLRPLMRYFLRHADVIAAVSPSTERIAHSHVPDTANRWVVAWNGLSFAADQNQKKQDRERIRIYTFCRLVERKNVANALRAIAELISKGYGNFEYVIAGDGPLRPALVQLANDLDLGAYVTFLGRIDDEAIPSLYAEADIFLHPQIAAEDGNDVEGFGLTIADAMSFGAAVIAGIDGGPADFIEDGKTGLIVDGRKPAEIARALERLLSDRRMLRTLGEAGRNWVRKNLSWRQSAEKILQTLNET